MLPSGARLEIRHVHRRQHHHRLRSGAPGHGGELPASSAGDAAVLRLSRHRELAGRRRPPSGLAVGEPGGFSAAWDSARKKFSIALLTGESTSGARAECPCAASAPAKYSRAARSTVFCARISTRTGRGVPSASSVVALTTSSAKARLMCTENAVARMIPSSSGRSLWADVTISRAFMLHLLPRAHRAPRLPHGARSGAGAPGAPRHLG